MKPKLWTGRKGRWVHPKRCPHCHGTRFDITFEGGPRKWDRVGVHCYRCNHIIYWLIQYGKCVAGLGYEKFVRFPPGLNPELCLPDWKEQFGISDSTKVIDV